MEERLNQLKAALDVFRSLHDMEAAYELADRVEDFLEDFLKVTEEREGSHE